VAGWLALLCAGGAALVALGHGPLATPPIEGWHAFSDWLAEHGLVLVTFSFLRMLSLGAIGYVLTATAVAGFAKLIGSRRLAAAAVRWAPGLRRFLAGALGLSVLTVTAASCSKARGVGRLPVAPASASSAAPVMRWLPDAPAARGAAASGWPAAGQTGTASVVPRTWTLRPGDHLWSVSKAVLIEAWGRPVTNAEIAPYWVRLVAANATHLRHPGNPSLVYPNDVVVIPPPPPPPAS
jgi:hypothetical protein